ncbi:MAG: Fic family protein [Candidatus Promineifilaceae bacterium]
MHPDDFRDSTAGRVIRTPQNYWAFVPSPLPPRIEWTPGLVSLLSEADRSLGELAGLGGTLANPHLLVRPFIRREAVLSSRIEGTRASLADLYLGEALQMTLFELPDDVREVHNYVEAMEHGLKRLEQLPVSLRLIRELHATLLEGVRGERLTPGDFRTVQNIVGRPGDTLATAAFVPPPPAEMLAALDALERFLHAPSNLPPLVRLALIHYQFEAIHAFLDGNGRVGRLLISLLLFAWRLLPQPLLYLSAYFEANRALYYECLLRVSQAGEWAEWLAYFLRGVHSQAADATARIGRLQALREAYRQRWQRARSAARLLQLVDLLFERPALSIREVSRALGVGYPTAQSYVDRLVAAGILREITGRARNRLYRADEILAAIDAPLERAPT